MKKFFFTSLFLALIIGTSFVKNTTKTLDKEIFEKRENITLLQNKYELVLLDFNYLSSPDRLKKYQQMYFEKELRAINLKNIKKLKIEGNSFQINE
tara:strand:+ start:127 stop:414 length:288 start_codon:yes stop_codon:yes gene_type:complete